MSRVLALSTVNITLSFYKVDKKFQSLLLLDASKILKMNLICLNNNMLSQLQYNG